MTDLVPRDNFFLDLFDFRRDFDQLFNRVLTDWPLRLQWKVCCDLKGGLTSSLFTVN